MNLDDSLREQAALYAVDALPADEAAKFRELARRLPELAALIAEYEAAAALIGETVPPVAPPPGLRSRILSSIAAPAAATPARPPSAARWVPWGIAAALIVTAAALWNQNLRLTDQTTQLAAEAGRIPGLEDQITQARRDTAGAEQLAAKLEDQVRALEKRSALAEMQVATLTSKLDRSYLASIAWDNDAQEGILKVRRLPTAERGKDYQLWVIDPHQPVPISAGVFTVAPDGSATIRFSPAHKVSQASTFAVSVEKSGGSPAPEGPIVLSN